MAVLLAFLAGFVLEGTSTWWVRVVERGEARRAGALAGLFAAAQVLGLERAFADRGAAAAYVAGFAVGSWAAVRVPQLLGRGKPGE